jgi:hypothetical protein
MLQPGVLILVFKVDKSSGQHDGRQKADDHQTDQAGAYGDPP